MDVHEVYDFCLFGRNLIIYVGFEWELGGWGVPVFVGGGLSAMAHFVSKAHGKSCCCSCSIHCLIEEMHPGHTGLITPYRSPQVGAYAL